MKTVISLLAITLSIGLSAQSFEFKASAVTFTGYQYDNSDESSAYLILVTNSGEEIRLEQESRTETNDITTRIFEGDPSLDADDIKTAVIYTSDWRVEYSLERLTHK